MTTRHWTPDPQAEVRELVLRLQTLLFFVLALAALALPALVVDEDGASTSRGLPAAVLWLHSDDLPAVLEADEVDEDTDDDEYLSPGEAGVAAWATTTELLLLVGAGAAALLIPGRPLQDRRHRLLTQLAGWALTVAAPLVWLAVTLALDLVDDGVSTSDPPQVLVAGPGLLAPALAGICLLVGSRSRLGIAEVGG